MFLLNMANSIRFNVVLFVMLICFVILLPLIDKAICSKLKLNLEHGISENPNADNVLKLRQVVLFFILGVYLFVNFYLVFLSRGESSRYMINTNFMYDVKHSLYIDIGIFGLIKDVIEQGFEVGISHIHIEKFEDITQVLANTMLYIPLGYLLPYTIESLRKKKRYTVLICFGISFITENVQLIFRRGFYDLDDMFFNTLGGLIGFLLFIRFAYWLTEPNWKKDERMRLKWNKRSYKKLLYFYSGSCRTNRISLIASSEEKIYSFYIDTLGFRLRGLDFSLESDESSMLVSLGDVYLEFRCLNQESEMPIQTVNISSKRLDKLRKKLIKNNIDVSDYEADKFTGRRTFCVNAPDNVTLNFSE